MECINESSKIIRVWDKPNDVALIFKQTKYKYAKKMMEEGSIKFNCARTWIEIAKEKGQGQGDLYEGTFATCLPSDVETVMLYRNKYDDIQIENDGKLLYFKRESALELPVFCFYSVKNSAFPVPEKAGYQDIECVVPASYFKDFADNMTEEQIMELDEDERPALVAIDKKNEFLNKIKSKLIFLGAKESEIEIYHIDYRYNFIKNSKIYFECPNSPDELFLKDSSFEHQSESRIVVNTKNEELIKRLKENEIKIGTLNEVAQLSTTYFIDGIRFVRSNANIVKLL